MGRACGSLSTYEQGVYPLHRRYSRCSGMFFFFLFVKRERGKEERCGAKRAIRSLYITQQPPSFPSSVAGADLG